MRILFLSHYFPPEGNAPASRTYENCKRWVREGHEVTVLTCVPNCPDGVPYEGYRNRIWQKETFDGIKVVRVWTYLAANKGRLRRTANYLSYMVSAVFSTLFVTRPDILIATSPQVFCGLAGIIAGRLRRVPVVLEIRDLWPESIVAVGAMRKGRGIILLEWLEQRMYAAAAHIVTVGYGYRNCLISRGVEPAKISVIANGADFALYSRRNVDPSLESRFGMDGKFVCLYCGTIGMACGLEIVIRAARILKEKGRENISFLMVGDGAACQNLEREAKREGLRNIVFAGRQPKSLIPDLLAMSDVCLVHLRKAATFKTVLPSKIFEAAAMAKPILLGVEGCASVLVREAEAGICFEPENAVQLAAEIEKLADDPTLAGRLGLSGREYVRRYYDREMLARRYLDLILRVQRSSGQSRVAGARTGSPCAYCGTCQKWTTSRATLAATFLAMLKPPSVPGSNEIKRCYKCMEVCFHGLAIPDLLQALRFQKAGEHARASSIYEEIPEQLRADRCGNCGLCEHSCPQGVFIRKEMSRAAVLLHALELGDTACCVSSENGQLSRKG